MKLKLRIKAANIKRGKRHNAHMCPIADALRDAGFTHPEVTYFDISAIKGGEIYTFNVHDRVRRFISQFDNSGRKGVKPRTFVLTTL